jgi:nucleotide-binding universal stress UspA family protein
MSSIRKIVLATDFSSSAQGAQSLAAGLASAVGAELHLLHAVVLHGDDLYGLALPVADLEEYGDRARQVAAGQLSELARPAEKKGLEVIAEVRRGTHAVSTILEYAGETEADLLILGTHGRRGPGRWLLGSVAEEVARRAPCAVLTVRGSCEETAIERFETILVPVDFSESSKEGLAVARELAATLGARLHLLHLVEPAIVPGPYGMLPAGQPAVFDYQALAERARGQLEELMEEGPAEGVEVHAEIGVPRVDIVEFANRIKADLIVQASRGLTGLPRLLIGSTAEQVLRTAQCPVLTVKREKPRES